LRQEDHLIQKFNASLSNIVRPFSKRKKKGRHGGAWLWEARACREVRGSQFGLGKKYRTLSEKQTKSKRTRDMA
jgi:hypothetical protein